MKIVLTTPVTESGTCSEVHITRHEVHHDSQVIRVYYKQDFVDDNNDVIKSLNDNFDLINYADAEPPITDYDDVIKPFTKKVSEVITALYQKVLDKNLFPF